jgi:hypothetical protein
MLGVAKDIRFAWRTLLKNPGFSAVVVLTLAIGIGANTAMFTVLNAVVLQPLPFPDPERLMVLLSSSEQGDREFFSSEGVYVDWHERSRSFESIEGGYGTGMIVTSGGRGYNVLVGKVSAGLFDLMGVQPILGRRFGSEEDQPGRAAGVLLDEGFWEREFSRSSDVLGRRLILDDKPFVVIGILPAGTGFAHTRRQDIWMPLEPRRQVRSGGPIIVVGRLKPGVTRRPHRPRWSP